MMEMTGASAFSEERQKHFVEQVMGLLTPQSQEEIAKALQPPPLLHIRQRLEERSVELLVLFRSTGTSGAHFRAGRRTDGSVPCHVGQGKIRTDGGQAVLIISFSQSVFSGDR